MAAVLDIEGPASLALLPHGSISGHLVDASTKQCYGIQGTEIKCERECSRGEDYKLVELSVLDFQSQKECTVIVEQRGADAARIKTANDAHGWEEEVLEAARDGRPEGGPDVSFECETLKADADAQRHIQTFLPGLEGQDAVVNIGRMVVRGIRFEEKKQGEKRGLESLDVGDVSNEGGRHDCEREGHSEWLGKKWKLERGERGGGWFTRTSVRETEAVAVRGDDGSDKGVGEPESLLGGGQSAEREGVSGGESLQEEIKRMDAQTGKKKEFNDAAGERGLRQAGEVGESEGSLKARLESIEPVIGLPPETHRRPTPLSRTILQDEDNKDAWI